MPKEKKSRIKAIVFDVDGVLVDVSQSYRLAVKKTAEFFLGKVLDMNEVEEIKNKGINDDYDAAEMIIQKYGGDFRKQAIIKKFQEYYLGRKFDGLLKNEKCLIKENVLKKLKKYKLAVFTGRPKEEAEFAITRFKLNKYFKVIVSMNDVKEGKPNPEGLLKAIKKMGVNNDEAVYVGDNIADLGTAKNAGVGFIGVIPPGSDIEHTTNLLKSEGAGIVLNNVNEIIKVIK